ncbi:hypothetical protein EDD18DRAFT_1348563 [Armillaria luteobubalina]|uniref:Uncharacterized protein n=1 Tax=Armillaria luteobubalina TaxID=153913 RepID=A0AA39QES0_9AGAR|nr:hypothetical protein EDD18DRAFT_1348563 [Armillaria luteobubalina]
MSLYTTAVNQATRDPSHHKRATDNEESRERTENHEYYSREHDTKRQKLLTGDDINRSEETPLPPPPWTFNQQIKRRRLREKKNPEPSFQFDFSFFGPATGLKLDLGQCTPLQFMTAGTAITDDILDEVPRKPMDVDDEMPVYDAGLPVSSAAEEDIYFPASIGTGGEAEPQGREEHGLEVFSHAAAETIDDSYNGARTFVDRYDNAAEEDRVAKDTSLIASNGYTSVEPDDLVLSYITISNKVLPESSTTPNTAHHSAQVTAEVDNNQLAVDLAPSCEAEVENRPTDEAVLPTLNVSDPLIQPVDFTATNCYNAANENDGLVANFEAEGHINLSSSSTAEEEIPFPASTGTGGEAEPQGHEEHGLEVFSHSAADINDNSYIGARTFVDRYDNTAEEDREVKDTSLIASNGYTSVEPVDLVLSSVATPNDASSTPGLTRQPSDMGHIIANLNPARVEPAQDLSIVDPSQLMPPPAMSDCFLDPEKTSIVPLAFKPHNQDMAFASTARSVNYNDMGTNRDLLTEPDLSDIHITAEDSVTELGVSNSIRPDDQSAPRPASILALEATNVGNFLDLSDPKIKPFPYEDNSFAAPPHRPEGVVDLGQVEGILDHQNWTILELDSPLIQETSLAPSIARPANILNVGTNRNSLTVVDLSDLHIAAEDITEQNVSNSAQPNDQSTPRPLGILALEVTNVGNLLDLSDPEIKPFPYEDNNSAAPPHRPEGVVDLGQVEGILDHQNWTILELDSPVIQETSLAPSIARPADIPNMGTNQNLLDFSNLHIFTIADQNDIEMVDMTQPDDPSIPRPIAILTLDTAKAGNLLDLSDPGINPFPYEDNSSATPPHRPAGVVDLGHAGRVINDQNWRVVELDHIMGNADVGQNQDPRGEDLSGTDGDDEGDGEAPRTSSQLPHRRADPASICEGKKRANIIKAISSLSSTWVLSHATSKEVRKYEKKARYKYGPQPGEITFDMGGNMGSLWNIRSKTVIVDRFLSSDDLPAVNDLTPAEVESAVKVHYKYLFDNHPSSPSSPTKRRSLDKTKEIAMANRRRGSKKRRCQGLRWYQKDPTARRNLERLEKMSVAAISADEEDAPNYIIKRPAWRSTDPRVIDFFTVPDYLYLTFRFHLGRRQGRKRGQLPRRRIDKGLVDHDSCPPAGLPKNMYDKSWLSILRRTNRHEYDRIRVAPAIDLETLVFSGTIYEVVNKAKASKLGRLIPSRTPLPR